MTFKLQEQEILELIDKEPLKPEELLAELCKRHCSREISPQSLEFVKRHEVPLRHLLWSLVDRRALLLAPGDRFKKYDFFF